MIKQPIKKKRDYDEYALQVKVCNYLNEQYPDVDYMSDTIAAVKLKVPQAIRNKAIQKDGFKCPDLIIFEKRGRYGALFIELKKESPYKQNGMIKTKKHLIAQQSTMQKLVRKGYLCTFSWELEMTKQIIDEYLNIQNVEN